MMMIKISPRNVLIRLARPTLVRSTHAQAASKFEDDSSSFKLSDDIAPENRYDIVINGGGIVGFSLLAAIKRSPFLASKRVLLIEQQKPPRVKTSSEASHDRTTAEASRVFSNRVSALTTSSKQFFENLGLWSQLEPNAKLVEGMYIWSDHYQNGIHFRSDDNLVCYILENDRMMRSLVEATIQSQSILYETTVTEIEQWPERNNLPSILLKLKCNNNKTSGEEDAPQRVIQTKMLVGCDGFKSTVRAKSTLPYYEHDLQQMGIVGTLAVDSPYPANQVAFQRFVSDDLVVALLPLDESHSSLVLSIPKRSLSQWMDLNDDEFVAQLNHTIIRETKVKSQLDKLASTFNLSGEGRNPMQSKHPPTIRSVVPGSRAAFPFAFGTTVPFLVGTIQSKVPLLQALTKRDNMVNTAIIGDAAHRVHPLAGQGLNLGLGDAAQLAESLESKMAAGYELFANTEDSRESLSQALFEFERARIPKLVPMLGAIHSMQTLFAYTPSAVLPLFNSFNWIKGQIVNFANSR